MANIGKIKFYLKELENSVGEFKDAAIKSNLESALKLAKGKKDEELPAVMIMPSIKDAMAKLYAETEFNAAYAEMGLELTPEQRKKAGLPSADPAVDPNNPLSQLGLGGATTGALGGALLAFATAKGGLGPRLMAAVKYALVGGAAGGAIGNWDEIKESVEPMLKSMGPMGDSLLNAFKDSSGTIAGITEAFSEWMGKMDGKTLMVGAVALLAAYMGFSKGSGVGSLFKACIYAGCALLAMWVAPTLLEAIGVDTSKFTGKNHEITDLTPANPVQIAHNNVPKALQLDEHGI